MKVYKIVLTVIDFDEVGQQGVIDALENARYPNRCIAPKVAAIHTADCGEWHDNHPLNKRDTADGEMARLLGA
jgi:hypothetical protein